MLLALLAEVYTFFKSIGILLVEKKGEPGDHLDALGVAYKHLVLFGDLVEGDHFDGLPAVLALIEAGRDCVALVGTCIATCNPVLWTEVLVPGIIAGERLDWGHIRVVKYFVLLG
jgi:hypothetical protein